MRITIANLGVLLLTGGLTCLWPGTSAAQSGDPERGDAPRAERLDRKDPPERAEKEETGDKREGRERAAKDPMPMSRPKCATTATTSRSEEPPRSEATSAAAPPLTMPGTSTPLRPEVDPPVSLRDAESPRDATHLRDPARRDASDMSELDKTDRELERKTKELASRYRHAPADQRAIIRTQLAELVARHFEVRQSLRVLQIKQLEEQLLDLRTSLEHRKAARDDIIQRRISELTDRAGRLDF